MNSQRVIIVKKLNNYLNMKYLNMKFECITFKYFTYKKTDAGRWNLSSCKIDIDKKIDLANYDNCFTNIYFTKGIK